MHRNNVCPDRIVPTDAEVRRMVAEPMLRLSYARGIDTIAVELGVNEKTVRRARDEEGTVHATTLIALFRRDLAFRQAMLAAIGERPVPLSAVCDSDPLPSTAGAVHKLACVTSPTSRGGKAIVDDECLEIEPEIDDAIASLEAIKARCHSIRAKRQELAA